MADVEKCTVPNNCSSTSSCALLILCVGSTSANDALKIRLLHPSGVKSRHHVFPPDFTYAIFGDEETIFGYEGLKITLDLQADTFRPNLHVQSKAKVEEVGETKADEPEEILREFMPCEYWLSSV